MPLHRPASVTPAGAGGRPVARNYPWSMGDGVLQFQITGLRRFDEAAEDPAPAGAHSFASGLRLARLVAEAPPGCRVELRSRGTDAGLEIKVLITASGTTSALPGLPGRAEVMSHLADEVAGMLGEQAVVGAVNAAAAANLPLDGQALRVRPRAQAESRRAGYVLHGQPDEDGIWGMARPVSPDALAKLLLAHPHVMLVQAIEPLDDPQISAAREDLADELAEAPGHPREEFLGIPARVAAALVPVDAPGTVPLRFWEHLRGWFSAVDLDFVPTREALAGEVMPEHAAAGLLRLPATTSTSFPGLDVVPRIVQYQRVTPQVDGVRIGSVWNLRNQHHELRLPPEVMSRHVHVIGETGSGKSTLLTEMALDCAASGEGLMFLDPHGQTVDRILAELDPGARERVWLVRCGDVANPVRLNPFAVDAPERELAIGNMLEAFQQLFDPNYQGIVGPRFQRTMRRALASLSAVRGRRTSLLDVPRVLEDPEMAKALAALQTDRELQSFWRNDMLGNRSADLAEVIAWVASKFTGFAMNPAIRAMLETGEDSFDPAEAMADGRIILIDLAKGHVGVTGARLIGMMYLLRFWESALRATTPVPFTAFVDEAGSFSSVPLAAMLAEGRKFGLRAVIAHQFMKQLDRDLNEAVEGSVATRLVFRVGHEDAKSLAVTTLPEFGVLDLAGLPQFVAAARLAATGLPLRPFTLEVDHNERCRPQPDAEQATREIRARTIADLVDPMRSARPMTLQDLRPPAGGPSGPAAPPTSFIDDWLAKRRPTPPDTSDDA